MAKYPGRLGKTRPPLAFSSLAPRGSAAKLVEARAEEDLELLDDLAEHLGLPRGNYFHLAVKLAELLKVPAFRVNRSGRPKKWGEFECAVLVVEIERITTSDPTRRTVLLAAKKLAKIEPWRSFVERADDGDNYPNPAEALRGIYSDHRDSKWTQVARDAFNACRDAGELHRWDAYVRLITS